MTIAHFIREIGRGKEGARNLSELDAYTLMSALLRGELSDLELGAVVLAMRMKGESIDELAGFLRAAHEHLLPVSALCLHPTPVVSLPSYNGARKLPNLVPLLAMLLAREGVQVLLHGAESEIGRVTTAQVFQALGLPVVRQASTAVAAIRAAWALREPVFVPLQVLSPPLAKLLEVRRVVGVRNSGHTIVKMLNPVFNPQHYAPCIRVVNYTHPEYCDSLSQYFTHFDADVLLMRGTEGEAVADARRSQAIDWFSGGQRTTLVEAQPGVLGSIPFLPRAIDAATTAAFIQSVLAGEHPVPLPIERQVECILQCVSVVKARQTNPEPEINYG